MTCNAGHFLYIRPLIQWISSRLTTLSKNHKQPRSIMYAPALGMGAEMVFARMIATAVAPKEKIGISGDISFPVSFSSLRTLKKKLRIWVTRKLKKYPSIP